MTKDKKKWKR